jgi:hypothetical protein
MTVVQAIKHSILTSNTPGLSVNTHPNAFMLNVIGTINLQTAAEQVLANLDRFAEAEQAREDAAAAKLKRESDAATSASATDGH